MPKYDSLRKLERNRLLVDYFSNHPELSLSEVGLVFGVSGQRVLQIVRGQEQKTGHKIVRRVSQGTTSNDTRRDANDAG